MAMIRSLSCLIVVLFLSSANAADTLSPFSALYKAKKGIFPLGSVCITLSPHGQGNLKYEFDGSGLIKELYESSILRLDDGLLQPLRFEHRESGKDVVTVFDKSNGVVTTTRPGKKDKVVSLPETTEVWDSLSVQLKLMTDLSENESLKAIKYRVVSKRGSIKTYKIKVEKSATVNTELGNFKARPVIVKNKDRQFWFAPELNYMPVEIDIDGTRLSLQSRTCEH